MVVGLSSIEGFRGGAARVQQQLPLLSILGEAMGETLSASCLGLYPQPSAVTSGLPQVPNFTAETQHLPALGSHMELADGPG